MNKHYDIIESKLINLYSAHSTKLNDTYLSNVIFPFKNILKESNDILYCKLGVFNAQIPVSFYTINVYTNVLKYQISSTIYTITLTRGNYNYTTLKSAMDTSFSNNGHNITMSFNKINGIITFTSTSQDFTFLSKSNGSTILDILGFNASVSYTSSSFILNAPYPLNLIGIQRLKINSNYLATSFYNSNNLNLSNTIASIPVNAPSFSLIQYQNTNEYSLLKASNISTIDIQIYDQDDNLINFNGIDWTITIQLNIYKRAKKEDIFMNNLKPILQYLQDIKNDLEQKQATENQSDLEVNPIENLDSNLNSNLNSNLDDIIPTTEENDLDLLLYNNPNLL